MNAIKVKQADGTIVTVVLGRDANTVTVKVGDSVQVEGFKTPMDANTVVATSFTGTDGRTVTLKSQGFDGRGCSARRPGIGRGFCGERTDSGSASAGWAPSGA